MDHSFLGDRNNFVEVILGTAIHWSHFTLSITIPKCWGDSEQRTNPSGVELIREGFQEEVSFETSLELGVWVCVTGRHEDDIPVVSNFGQEWHIKNGFKEDGIFEWRYKSVEINWVYGCSLVEKQWFCLVARREELE